MNIIHEKKRDFLYEKNCALTKYLEFRNNLGFFGGEEREGGGSS